MIRRVLWLLVAIGCGNDDPTLHLRIVTTNCGVIANVDVELENAHDRVEQVTASLQADAAWLERTTYDVPPNGGTISVQLQLSKALARGRRLETEIVFSHADGKATRVPLTLVADGDHCFGPPSITPDHFDFGDVACGASAAPVQATVSNPTDEEVTFVASVPKGFTVVMPSNRVPAHGKTDFTVTASPVPFSAELPASSSDSLLSMTTSLRGDAVHEAHIRQRPVGAIVSLSTNWVDFGRQQVDTTPTRDVFITNDGNLPVTISGTADHYALNVATIPPRSTAVAQLTYSPDPDELAVTDAADIPLTFDAVSCGAAQSLHVTGVAFDRAVQVAATNLGACVLTSTGRVYCWGTGALGRSTPTMSTTPLYVSGLKATRIDSGTTLMTAIDSGDLKYWGEIIDKPFTPHSLPTPVAAGFSGVASASSGDYTVCAVFSSGSVKCMGFGYLGDGTNQGSTTFVDAVGVTTASEISVGWLSSTCVLLTSGDLNCWGQQFWNTKSATDVGVSNVSHAYVDSGGLIASHTTGELKVWTWKVTTVPNISKVSELARAICALESTGVVKCYPHDSYYQNMSVFSITGIGKVQDIAAGFGHVCAVETSGKVACWLTGLGSTTYDNGVLGVGDTLPRPAWTPFYVVGFD